MVTSRWVQSVNNKSRRITVNTPVIFSGPAKNSPLLINPINNSPAGTLNNCGAGYTPWGTYLSCEENINGYFGASEGMAFDKRLSPEQQRYGFDSEGFGYGWEKFDPRFDLSNSNYVNESHRFGWVVEIDPYDHDSVPVKRTALGRFKHEAVAIAESTTGHIAAYMGDDQRFDYCYKYLSSNAWEQALEQGESPLDNGSLYVAKFNEDGSGEWLELTIENPLLAERFSDQAELLIYTRIAADLLGATPMDRPEWTSVGKQGEVFWSFTNNVERTQVNAMNPEAPNYQGHIIRTIDADDQLGLSFQWELFFRSSNTSATEQALSNPDLVWADNEGRLFVGTDGRQERGLANQLVVFDTTQEFPIPRRLLTGVKGCEITGFAITPDQRTAFVNVQHPGNGDPTISNFPARKDNKTIPRDCTLVITRKDGGIVGS